MTPTERVSVARANERRRRHAREYARRQLTSAEMRAWAWSRLGIIAAAATLLAGLITTSMWVLLTAALVALVSRSNYRGAAEAVADRRSALEAAAQAWEAAHTTLMAVESEVPGHVAFPELLAELPDLREDGQQP
jgi:hypothetical protein